MTKTWTGHVTAPESNFKTAEDGTVSFRPMNANYGIFRPSPAPGGAADPNACTLELRDGEYFQVLEHTDKTEGRGPLRAVANYLDYPAAFSAARGLGVQGFYGEIHIMTPSTAEVVAIDADGSQVVVSSALEWHPTRLESRLVFPNREPRNQLRDLLADTLGIDAADAEKGADAVLEWLASHRQAKG